MYSYLMLTSTGIKLLVICWIFIDNTKKERKKWFSIKPEILCSRQIVLIKNGSIRNEKKELAQIPVSAIFESKENHIIAN